MLSSKTDSIIIFTLASVHLIVSLTMAFISHKSQHNKLQTMAWLVSFIVVIIILVFEGLIHNNLTSENVVPYPSS